MNKQRKSQIKKIGITLVLMLIGLYFFKWQTMALYGEDILFDASAHIVFTSLILYSVYEIINKNKTIKIQYTIFSIIILIIVSMQRIQVNAHNYIGLLKGFLIAIISIAIANVNTIKKKLNE